MSLKSVKFNSKFRPGGGLEPCIHQPTLSLAHSRCSVEGGHSRRSLQCSFQNLPFASQGRGGKSSRGHLAPPLCCAPHLICLSLLSAGQEGWGDLQRSGGSATNPGSPAVRRAAWALRSGVRLPSRSDLESGQIEEVGFLEEPPKILRDKLTALHPPTPIFLLGPEAGLCFPQWRADIASSPFCNRNGKEAGEPSQRNAFSWL